MMKTKFLVSCLAVFAAIASTQAADDLSTTLQRGLFEEEANHDLPAAIKAYESVVTATDAQRKLAGTALFRLAECYRKLGRTNDAVAHYQRVMREYPDQPKLVDLSREYLVNSAPATLGAARDSERTRLLERALSDAQSDASRLSAFYRQLTNSTREELRLSLPTSAPDPLLNTLQEQRAKAEQRLAELRQTLSREHPDVKSATAALEVISEQIDERINGILAGLKVKLQSQQAQVTQLQKELDDARRSAPADLGPANTSFQERLNAIVERAAPGKLPAATPTDEEDKEVRRIQALIKDSPDLVNAGGQAGATPLHTAASKGQLVVTRFLLANKANVSARSQGNMTPLHQAVMNGHKSMAELLLANGAEVNASADQEGTPLHYAAGRGFKAIVELLLASKADPNAVNDNNSSPLHAAVAKGYKSVVEVLLDAGADVNVISRITEPNPDQYPHRVGTPLHLAVNDGNKALTELLMTRRSDVNLRNQFGETPLQLVGNQVEIAALLIAAKADVNASVQVQGKDFGKTPLCFAVLNGLAEMVELLLKNGANPNVRYRDNRNGEEHTPLTAALSLDRLPYRERIVAMLLEFKANPNLKDGRGNSALHISLFSVFGGSTNLPDLLLKHGADVDARDAQGDTPLAWRSTGKEIKELLLNNKANPNTQNNEGNTPLHRLVERTLDRDPSSQKELAELLIARGADVNLRNRQGLTPLNRYGVPARPGNPDATELAEVLRKHGAKDEQLDLEPDPDSIRVWRKGMASGRVVFVRDAAGQNRFTLMEAILNFYSFLHYTPPARAPRPEAETRVQPGRPIRQAAVPSPLPGQPQLLPPPGGVGFGRAMQSNYDPLNEIPFPDLTRIRILRLVDAAKNEKKVISVNLINAAGIVLCANDTLLEFGDIIEIPEREYRLDEGRVGLAGDQNKQFLECLPRKVQFVVKGVPTEVRLMPVSTIAYLASAMKQSPVRNVLRSSSDLSRLRIRRRADVAINQPARELTVDLEAFQRSGKQQWDDLWLRDGDVIEVPEREQ